MAVAVVVSTHSKLTSARRPQALAPKLLRYKLEMLTVPASQQLFRQCAGRQGSTDAGPAGLEDKVILACGGLPLALELAGGVLWQENDSAIWQARPCQARASQPATCVQRLHPPCMTNSYLAGGPGRPQRRRSAAGRQPRRQALQRVDGQLRHPVPGGPKHGEA